MRRRGSQTSPPDPPARLSHRRQRFGSITISRIHCKLKTALITEFRSAIYGSIVPMAGSDDLMSVSLDATLTGPAPWNIALTIFLEELPQEGFHLERRFRHARVDGSTYVWIGRRRSTGKGNILHKASPDSRGGQGSGKRSSPVQGRSKRTRVEWARVLLTADLGTARCLGIFCDPIFLEINRSN